MSSHSKEKYDIGARILIEVFIPSGDRKISLPGKISRYLGSWDLHENHLPKGETSEGLQHFYEVETEEAGILTGYDSILSADYRLN